MPKFFKLICFLLAIVLLGIACKLFSPPGSFAFNESSAEFMGDLNLDGKINDEDVRLWISVLFKLELDPEIVDRADINKDGKANASDVQAIINAALSSQENYVVITQEASSFSPLATYFAQQKKARLISYQNEFSEIIPNLASISPQYAAIVLPPELLTPDLLDSIDEELRNVDTDPFLDVAYGIITSFTIEDGYMYVDRLLRYQSPLDISLYRINMNYRDGQLIKRYGINAYERCSSSIMPCDVQGEATVERIQAEILDYDFLGSMVHGIPDRMLLGFGEDLHGDRSGVIGRKKVGESFENVSLNFNLALLLSEACMTARINGTPNIIQFEDQNTPGNVDTSIALSFLKSGVLNFIGPPHVAHNVFFPEQAFAGRMIFQGESIGEILKDFKNQFIFSTVIQQKDLEGHPRADEYTIGFTRHHLRNWILFGDPSLSFSNQNLVYEDCIKSLEEHRNGKEATVTAMISFLDENGIFLGNTKYIGVVTQNGENVSAPTACSFTIPLDGKLTNLEIQSTGVHERFYGDFIVNQAIVENAGDELIVFIPDTIIKAESKRESVWTFSITYQ